MNRSKNCELAFCFLFSFVQLQSHLSIVCFVYISFGKPVVTVEQMEQIIYQTPFHCSLYVHFCSVLLLLLSSSLSSSSLCCHNYFCLCTVRLLCTHCPGALTHFERKRYCKKRRTSECYLARPSFYFLYFSLSACSIEQSQGFFRYLTYYFPISILNPYCGLIVVVVVRAFSHCFIVFLLFLQCRRHWNI